MPKLLHIREMPEIQAVRIYLQGGGLPERGNAGSRRGDWLFAATRDVGSCEPGQLQRANGGRENGHHRPSQKLRVLGYAVKRGKRWKKPTYREITETMPYAQCRSAHPQAERQGG